MAPVERALTITRVFDAPRELVWKAWTDQAHARHWWGPRHHPSTLSRSMRASAAVAIRLSGAEDGRELWHGACSAKSSSPNGWSYVESDKDAEPVRKTSSASRSRRRRQDPHGFPADAVRVAEEREGHTEGWSSTFDRLEEPLLR